MLEIFQWWLEQLRELVPWRLLRLILPPPDAILLSFAGISDQGTERESAIIDIALRRRGKIARLGRFTAGPGEVARLRAAVPEKRLPSELRLRVPSAWVLRKTLFVPLAARGSLPRILAQEMERETPFTLDEVFWGYTAHRREAAPGKLAVELVVLPTHRVASLIDFATGIGLTPSGVEIADTGEEDPILWPPATSETTIPGLRGLRGWAAATILLAGTAIILPFIRQQMALGAAEAAAEGLRAQAEEAATLRKQINGGAAVEQFLAQERQRIGSPLGVLASLTRVIPDDSYLTELTLHAGHLTIAGQSPAAAELVKRLAETPPFKDPAFASPVLRSEGSSLENFSITVALSPDGAP